MASARPCRVREAATLVLDIPRQLPRRSSGTTRARDRTPVRYCVRMPPIRRSAHTTNALSRGGRVFQINDDVTFGVHDFKSLASAQLEPHRLTILTGANSSGKSSLLQALLFFAQSFGEPSVVINGDLVRLGEGVDVIRDGAESVTLEFRYAGSQGGEPTEARTSSAHVLQVTLDSPSDRSGLTASAMSLWVDDSCLFSVARADAPDGIGQSPDEQLLGRVAPDSTDADTESDLFVALAGITPIRLAYRVAPDALNKIVYTTLERTGLGRLGILSEIIGSSETQDDAARLAQLMSRFQDDEIVDSTDPELAMIFDRSAEIIAPDGWLTAPIAATPRIAHGFGLFRLAAFRQPDMLPDRPRQVVAELAASLDGVQRLAEAVTYLGPLRDDPRVAYPLGHTVSGLPVGEKGEFTAAYLLDNRSVQITYGRPDGSVHEGLLPGAVTQWCQYLGIAEEVKVEAMGKLGHKLRLRVGGKLRDPTAIGVGASQLLPVVALVLGAPAGSLVLMEQPELHLHPKVQSRLADFFALARPDVRLVVETHSEYLLTRLRVRIAENTLAPTDVAVLFAAQRPIDTTSSQSTYTEFRKLTLDELGDFDVWPQDFFDSLGDDSVALAEAVASRVRRGMRPGSG